MVERGAQHGAVLGAVLVTGLAVGFAAGCSDDPVKGTTSTGVSATTSTGTSTTGAGGAGTGGATTSTGTSTTGTGGAGTGGEGGSEIPEPPGVVGTEGQACPTPGEHGCAGYAQDKMLLCGQDHLWAAAGACAASERCDSAYGPDQGTCKAVLPLCEGKASKEILCTGNTRVRCGADLVSSEILGPCPFLCSGGLCIGACAPMAKQCAGAVQQTCDAKGEWKGGASCPYACLSGVCTGVCVPGGGDCMGKIPLTCDDTGKWQDKQACQIACIAGKCAGVCAPGSTRCNGNGPEVCDGQGIWQAQPPCPIGLPTCVAGACSAAPSCLAGADGAGDTCGPAGNENCCASPLVPGGTFNRIQDPNYPATVSDFKLDRFEITVGRFRQWVNGYPGTIPKEGDGAHSKIPGSGWSTMWNSEIPQTHEDMIARLTNVGINTWTNQPGPHESKPLNWLSWYLVFAFCAWDGGRLPTEAEWNYAGAGGAEQRYRVWGTMDLDASYAVYDCTGDGSGSQDCMMSDVFRVGSRSPKGDGKWGQADLLGGVWEWNLDFFADPIIPASCVDCANLVSSPEQIARGGSFSAAENRMNTVFRNYLEPSYRKHTVGGRCARNP